MELTKENVAHQLEMLKTERAEALRNLDRLDGEITGMAKILHHMNFDPKATPPAGGATLQGAGTPSNDKAAQRGKKSAGGKSKKKG